MEEGRRDWVICVGEGGRLLDVLIAEHLRALSKLNIEPYIDIPISHRRKKKKKKKLV